jgi:hypothetical protein
MSLLLELMKICNILCMFLNNPQLGLGSMFSLKTIFGLFYLLFVFIYAYLCPTWFPYHVLLFWFINSTTGVIRGAGTMYPSGAATLTSVFVGFKDWANPTKTTTQKTKDWANPTKTTTQKTKDWANPTKTTTQKTKDLSYVERERCILLEQPRWPRSSWGSLNI